jgi:hypothetical protein
MLGLGDAEAREGGQPRLEPRQIARSGSYWSSSQLTGLGQAGT